tara:strand:- start:760 stop:1167 length:408 start_codon:yes stop_codon:yes gene_type:complete
MSSIPVNYDSGSVLKLNVTFRYERYVVENVTRGMIRSGWKGYSDSFDPWMGKYGDFNSGNMGFGDEVKEKTPIDKTVVQSSVQGTWYGQESTIELQQMSAETNAQIFDSTAIPGDYDYKGDRFQGTVNGILVPKI